MGNVKSRNDFNKTNRKISRNLSQPQLLTSISSLTSSSGRELNQQQQQPRQQGGGDNSTTTSAKLTTEAAVNTDTTTTAVGGPLVDVDVKNTNDNSQTIKNNKAKEDPHQTRRQRQQKAADSSAACAVALTEQQQRQQLQHNSEQQRLKQASFWSLGSLNWNLSFSGRNSYKQRQKSLRKSFSTLQYQRRSKTQWHRPITNAIFSSHFKESSRNGEFHIDRLVAKGAFGVVFRVVDKNSIQQRAQQQQPHAIANDPEFSNNTPAYALKVLKKSKIISGNSVQQIKDEADIQKLCGHHPFIVKQFDLWQNRYNLHILSEFVPNGELFSKISIFSLSLIRVYLAEIALALDFLHNAGIIYRDAKPENILLTADYHLKLTDFGLSKWLKFGLTTKTVCGTFQYMVFDLTMEGRQVDEAVASIFHTVLFHRCLGKYMYTGDAQYSIGTVGYTDVDCDFIDFTYVCCTSDSLQRTVKRAINVFSEKLRSNESCGSGQISLEFFQKKKSRWPFAAECIPWEVWTIHLDLIKHEHEDERQMCRENVADLLTEKVIYITEIMNRHDYVPKTPSQSELDLIFDTTYPDVQPYLFKFVSSTSDYAAPSMGNAMKKIIKETLAL